MTEIVMRSRDDTSFASEVARLLDYNPETGAFVWRVKHGRGLSMKRPGDAAGCACERGYLLIGLHGKVHFAHRLAVLIMTGSLPTEVVDHINGNGMDNRWVNLRCVSHQENHRNTKIRKNNTSGMMGVAYIAERNRWVARINVNGAGKHLGYFEDVKDAKRARKAAECRFGFHANHGRVTNG